MNQQTRQACGRLQEAGQAPVILIYKEANSSARAVRKSVTCGRRIRLRGSLYWSPQSVRDLGGVSRCRMVSFNGLTAELLRRPQKEIIREAADITMREGHPNAGFSADVVFTADAAAALFSRTRRPRDGPGVRPICPSIGKDPARPRSQRAPAPGGWGRGRQRPRARYRLAVSISRQNNPRFRITHRQGMDVACLQA
jgi:hypothetical protein